MKNVTWLGLIFITLGIGFYIGWIESARVDTKGEHQIRGVNKGRLIPKKEEIITFNNDYLDKLKSDEDKKYVLQNYIVDDVKNIYKLKKDVTRTEKLKLYNIFKAADLIEEPGGEEEGGGYGK